jgi:FtsZ-interacting cell division protein ZipA
MELTAILLIVAVIVLVGVFLSAPFMTRVRRGRVRESREVSALKAERDRVVNSLQELDFDFNLGKIPAEEYPKQRAALLQKGAGVLRQLDELAPVASSASAAETRIEKATAAARADAPVEAAHFSDDDLESMIVARRKVRKSKSAGFCPKCGKSALASDKFCPACGKALN